MNDNTNNTITTDMTAEPTEPTGPAPSTPPQLRPRRPIATLVSAICLIAVTAGALALGWLRPKDAAPVTVSAVAGSFSVTLFVADPVAGTRGAEIIVTNADGGPVVGAEVIANASMQSMGHAGEVAVGTAGVPGHYRLDADLFPMSGRWNVEVFVEGIDSTSTVSFPIDIVSR